MTKIIPIALMRGADATAETLLAGYRRGFFPLANDEINGVVWNVAEPRALAPLDALHVPKSLKKTARRAPFEISVDQDFTAVFDACAGRGPLAPQRPGGWMSDDLRRAYLELAERGVARSVECRRNGALVAGLYGLAIGGAFFGESMFTRVDDGSKIALFHLVARLRAGGFVLLDCQMATDHMARFGLEEVPHTLFVERLAAAFKASATWSPEPARIAAELDSVLGRGAATTEMQTPATHSYT